MLCSWPWLLWRIFTALRFSGGTLTTARGILTKRLELLITCETILALRALHQVPLNPYIGWESIFTAKGTVQ